MFALVLLLAGPAAMPAGMDAAQTAYVGCLAAESDAALRERVPVDRFAEGAERICEAETTAFRAAAMPLLLAQAGAVDEAAARQDADARFAAMDAAHRARLVTAYQGKLRARRGVRPVQ